MLGKKAELLIGATVLLFGLLVVSVWVPFDSETWMIETFRRQTTMGDAFLPMIAGGLVLICATLHLLTTALRKDDLEAVSPVLDGNSLAFLVQLSGITAISLAIMYWAGPLAVQLFASSDGAEVAGYRQMRGTYPYKIIGFALGGFAMVFVTTSMIEGRCRITRIVSSALAVAVLVAVFDLPFDNVLLPPNGDW